MKTCSINEVLDRIQCEFGEKLAQRRSIVMDVCEGLLDTSPHWPILRKKLLSFFGESGAHGDLQNIVERIKQEYSEPAQLAIASQQQEQKNV